MKVVEYWHGTIKNYRYDGDVSGVIRQGDDAAEAGQEYDREEYQSCRCGMLPSIILIICLIMV